jgi:hypothetical protein
LCIYIYIYYNINCASNKTNIIIVLSYGDEALLLNDEFDLTLRSHRR